MKELFIKGVEEKKCLGYENRLKGEMPSGSL